MANTPRFCPKCGLPVEEGARFCQGCGEKLPALRSASREPDTTPRKGKMDWKPFLIGLGVLSVIGVVFVICVVGVIILNRLGDPVSLLTTRLPRETPGLEATLPPAVPGATEALPSAKPPTETPTQQPSATLPSTPGPNVVYNGIRLSYDLALGAGYNAQSIPANPASDQTAPWDVAPQHVQIDFQGYALKDTFHTPSLYIYPAAEYVQSSEAAAQIIAGLGKMLAEKPQGADHLPFLPVWNAGQMIHARMAYLDFRTGSGVRFLTQYGQAIFPINSQNMFYTFQGLTADGKYYISFVLPIGNPVLPTTGDLSQAEYAALESDYQNYIQGVVNTLESQPPESFQPDLGKLDQMVESLEVK